LDSDTAHLLDRAIVAIVAAVDQLDGDPGGATQGVKSTADALNLLEQVEQKLLPLGGEQVPHRLLDIRLAKADLLASQMARQRSMLPVLNQALHELRGAASIEELADAIPYQSVQLGYERALFSWVDDEHWVPRSAHVLSNGPQARALLDAGSPPYLHVRDLFEVEVVRGRRPILVKNAEGNPRVHPRLQEVNHSHDYVAAPVVALGHVAAFVHLDRNLDSGTTDEFDRDLLAALCQGIGLMLDHLLASSPQGSVIPQSLTSSWPVALTVREREVLQLVAAGCTNADIGARLFLGEETVKTHLKKLMRKLGVSNRAQAGALYASLQSRAGAERTAPRSGAN
jgi:DNA-binding CsgD family transcriptional regulator